MAQQIDPATVPDNALLPLRAAQPRLIDWNFKSGLSPVQLSLLAMYNALSFAAKAELTHGMKEGEFIPAHKIKLLWQQEQARKKPGASADVLKDTTESDLG